MKLKDQKKLGILYLVLGAALFLVGLLTDAGEKNELAFLVRQRHCRCRRGAPAARVPAHP